MEAASILVVAAVGSQVVGTFHQHIHRDRDLTIQAKENSSDLLQLTQRLSENMSALACTQHCTPPPRCFEHFCTP